MHVTYALRWKYALCGIPLASVEVASFCSGTILFTTIATMLHAISVSATPKLRTCCILLDGTTNVAGTHSEGTAPRRAGGHPAVSGRAPS